jgi:hypothetical protein
MANESGQTLSFKPYIKYPTLLEKTENLNLRSLSLKTLKPEQSPPMQHCKAKPTDSSFKGNDLEEKEATRKNSFANREGGKWTEHPKRRRT